MLKMKMLPAGLWLVLCLTSAPVWASEEVGRIIGVTPSAQTERAGKREDLALKSPVFKTDVVRTDAAGKAQILFLDDTTVAVAPNTEVRIEEYMYDEKEGGNFALSMANGVARVVTGKIVKANPEGFKVVTPLSVIGIRGTDCTIIAGAKKTTVISNRIHERDIRIRNTTTGVESRINKSGMVVEASASGNISRPATMQERAQATQAVRRQSPQLVTNATSETQTEKTSTTGEQKPARGQSNNSGNKQSNNSESKQSNADTPAKPGNTPASSENFGGSTGVRSQTPAAPPNTPSTPETSPKLDLTAKPKLPTTPETPKQNPPVNPTPPIVDPNPPVNPPVKPPVAPNPPVDPPVVDPTPPVVDPNPPVVDPTPPVVDPNPPVDPPVVPDPPVDLPIVDPNPPVVDPTPPVVDPTPPVDPPVVPDPPVDLPVVDPTPPVVDPNPPVVDPTPPVVDPNPPVVDPTPPVVDPTPPVVDPNPPVVDPTPPVVDPNPPVVDPTPPVVDPNPPVVDPTPPVVDPTPPVDPPVVPDPPVDPPVVPDPPVDPPIVDPVPPVVDPNPQKLSGVFFGNINITTPSRTAAAGLFQFGVKLDTGKINDASLEVMKNGVRQFGSYKGTGALQTGGAAFSVNNWGVSTGTGSSLSGGFTDGSLTSLDWTAASNEGTAWTGVGDSSFFQSTDSRPAVEANPHGISGGFKGELASTVLNARPASGTFQFNVNLTTGMVNGASLLLNEDIKSVFSAYNGRGSLTGWKVDVLDWETMTGDSASLSGSFSENDKSLSSLLWIAEDGQKNWGGTLEAGSVQHDPNGYAPLVMPNIFGGFSGNLTGTAGLSQYIGTYQFNVNLGSGAISGASMELNDGGTLAYGAYGGTGAVQKMRLSVADWTHLLAVGYEKPKWSGTFGNDGTLTFLTWEAKSTEEGGTSLSGASDSFNRQDDALTAIPPAYSNLSGYYAGDLTNTASGYSDFSGNFDLNVQLQSGKATSVFMGGSAKDQDGATITFGHANGNGSILPNGTFTANWDNTQDGKGLLSGRFTGDTLTDVTWQHVATGGKNLEGTGLGSINPTTEPALNPRHLSGAFSGADTTGKDASWNFNVLLGSGRVSDAELRLTHENSDYSSLNGSGVIDNSYKFSIDNFTGNPATLNGTFNKDGMGGTIDSWSVRNGTGNPVADGTGTFQK